MFCIIFKNNYILYTNINYNFNQTEFHLIKYLFDFKFGNQLFIIFQNYICIININKMCYLKNNKTDLYF